MRRELYMIELVKESIELVISMELLMTVECLDSSSGFGDDIICCASRFLEKQPPFFLTV